MPKLQMLKGLPASGKSTFAKEIMEASGNTIRLNRDLLREMLHCGKWTAINEGHTVDAEKKLAHHFLRQGKNVIIDDTNLGVKHRDMWATVASLADANFEMIEMDADWQTCCARDSARIKPAGTQVIKSMAIENNLITFKADSVVLCDLDGTLCDLTHRLPHVEKTPKDWPAFFAGIADDKVISSTRDLLIDLYNKGKTIIFVSARPETYRKETEEWLSKHFLSFAFALFMRPAKDGRPDVEIKQKILDRYFKDRSVIHQVIDDRPSVIRMWRSNFLPVIDVGKGIEF